MGDRRAAVVFTDPPYNLSIDKVTGLGTIQHRNFTMAAGELSEDQFTDFLTQVCSLLAKHGNPSRTPAHAGRRRRFFRDQHAAQ